jgi:heat induced stress protein YflT
MTMSRLGGRPVLNLNYPISLAVYDTYEKAQRAVDHLSNNAFPVQNVAIIGTGLRSIERVTGRLTRSRRAVRGTISGLWLGMFVGITFALFSKDAQLGVVIATPLLGALLGLAWSQVGFAAATRGAAGDYSSVSQVVATNYEIVVEHTLAERARELLATIPIQ